MSVQCTKYAEQNSDAKTEGSYRSSFTHWSDHQTKVSARARPARPPTTVNGVLSREQIPDFEIFNLKLKSARAETSVWWSLSAWNSINYLPSFHLYIYIYKAKGRWTLTTFAYSFYFKPTKEEKWTVSLSKQLWGRLPFARSIRVVFVCLNVQYRLNAKWINHKMC